MRDQIENSIRDRLFDLETPAPDLFNKIAAKRTPFYIFRNKILLNKFKLMGAAALILAVLWIWPKAPIAPKTIEQDGQKMSELILERNANDQKVDENLVDEDISISESSDPEIEKTIESELEKPSRIRNAVVADGKVDGDDATTDEKRNVRTVFIQNPEIDMDVEESHAPIVEGASGKEIEKAENIKIADVVDIETEQDPEVAIEENEEENPTIGEVKIDSLELDLASVPSSGDIDIIPFALKPWSAQLSYGASYAGRFLSGNSAYKDLRNEQEKVLYSDNIKLQVNYTLSNHVELFTGLTYGNRNESVNAAIEQSEMVWETKTRDVVIHDPVIGTYTKQVTYNELVEQKSRKVEQCDNKYQRLIVPIGLRWNGYAGKFAWSPSLSMGYQVWNRNTGKVLSANMESMSDLAIAPLRKPTGIVQVGSSIGMAYRLNHRWSMLAEPGIQYYLSPVSAPQYLLKQRDYSIDLNFGLKYNF